MENGKVTFKITLTSDPKHPFRILQVPDKVSFKIVRRFAAEEFGVSYANSPIFTYDGASVNLEKSAESVFVRYGSDLRLVAKD